MFGQIKIKKSPYEYFPTSADSVWWKCENGEHKDYYRIIRNSTLYEFRCPECSNEEVVSVLHRKIRSFLLENYSNINMEHKCTLLPVNPKTKYRMPFDFEIKKYKLIIECHGEQHYKPSTGMMTPKKYDTRTISP